MKKYISEFIGTCLLVFLACGAAVFAGSDVVAVALAFGLVVTILSYSLGNISGCHVNPAVSLGMLINGKMTVKDFFGYIVAQFLGGIAGAALLRLFFAIGGNTLSQYATSGSCTFGANSYGDANSLGLGIGAAILIEVILTFVFVIAVMGITSKKEWSNIAGLLIGLALALVHIIGVPLTGTSVNPARSLGPAIFARIASSSSLALNQVWVFIVAPLVGATIAGFVWLVWNKTKKEVEEPAVA